MHKDTVLFSSKTINLAETDTYIELTNRVCYYNEPNANGVKLLSDNALEKAQTLINMPVVAKYAVNHNNQPTFKGHEAYIDENGELQFNTDSIGTHTQVYIQEDTVDVNGVQKTLPCLFAKYRIWTRNKNVVSAVKRLYSEGKLYSSWEIVTLAYEFKDNVKTITDYKFLANCLLGYEYSFPAYGKDAKAISLSNQEAQLLIAEALAKDILDSKAKEEGDVNKESIEKVVNNATENTEIIENNENPSENVDNKTETSSLTEWDLRMKITEACREKLGKWCWIAFHFPIEKTVWLEIDGRESELDYILMTYEVSENDEISVSEPQEVKLTVKVSEINSTIENLNAEIEKKNEAIVKANETIQSLNAEIANLKVYKEKFEKAEQEKIEAELKRQKEELKNYALQSGCITANELEESEELKGYIENLNKKEIQAIIADRVVNSLVSSNGNIETSTIKTETSIEKLNLTNIDEVADYKSIIRSYINK